MVTSHASLGQACESQASGGVRSEVCRSVQLYSCTCVLYPRRRAGWAEPVDARDEG